jgi:ribosomal protein S18 acetylase RimI-like enzyme
MRIRQATTTDAALLAALNHTVQQLHHERRPELFKPPQITDDIIHFYEDALSQPDDFVFICYLDEQAVGYIYLKIIRSPENPFTYARDYLLIDQISVNADQQGKGCGRALMQAAYDFARQKNIRRITLGVLDFNADAIDFYHKQGFRVYHQRMELLLD